jgi:uncharacterized membrane protein YbhN (UPF0104 family)
MSAEPADAAVVAEGRRARWRPGGGVIGLVASAALLAVLYRGLDIRLIVATLARADPGWLLVSVLLILPITFLRGLRFYWVAPRGALPGVAEAFRLTVVSSALNVFLPAKSGDLVKSYFVATRSGTSAGASVAIVLYERLCDMACLIAWCMVGWVVGKPDVPGLPAWFWPLLGLVGVGCGLLIVSDRLATALLTTVVRLLPSKVPRKLVDSGGRLARTAGGAARAACPGAAVLAGPLAGAPVPDLALHGDPVGRCALHGERQPLGGRAAGGPTAVDVGRYRRP